MASRLYTVTGQVPIRGLGPGGQLIDLYELHYEGPNGITGWIRVPVATATPEAVDELIRRRLDQQLQLASLGE